MSAFFDKLFGIQQTQQPRPSLRNAPQDFEIRVPVNGSEIFTPYELIAGRVYRVTLSGTYSCCERHCRRGDALYQTDHGRWVRYPNQVINGYGGGVYVDGVNVAAAYRDFWYENRAQHVYCYWAEGTGQQVGVALVLPAGGLSTLKARFELEPEDVLSSREQQEQARADERHRREQLTLEQQQMAAELEREAVEEHERVTRAVALAEETRQQADREQKKRAALLPEVAALKAIVLANKTFLDPELRNAFVLQHSAELSSSLKAEWTDEYVDLMRQCDLVELLKNEAPEVLHWHAARLEMVAHAERLLLMPEMETLPDALSGTLPFTARNARIVEALIASAFQLRDEYSRILRAQAQDGTPHLHRSELSSCIRTLRFCLQELERYGITASSPEEAEAKLWKLYPILEAPASEMDQINNRIKALKKTSTEEILARLHDLQRENSIRSGMRRSAVKAQNVDSIERIDERLQLIRREFAELKACLQKRGDVVEVSLARPERPAEETLETKFSKEFEQYQRIKEKLPPEDTELHENVDTVFAERFHNLFKADFIDYDEYT